MIQYINPILNKLIGKIRTVWLNYYWLHRNAFSKRRVSFGRNVLIEGYCHFGSNCVLNDNVEIRSGKYSQIHIGNFVSINRNSLVIGEVKIGDYVSIAPNCVIVGSNHVFSDITKYIKQQGITTKGIKIEDDVWIGANVTILDGITIGMGSVIGGGSVVTKSIPQYSIAVGNPAKVIKNRK